MSNFASKYTKDSGDLVQTVIIVAGFAVASILLIAAVGSAVNNKGKAAANCISGAGNFTGSNGNAAKNCKKADNDATKQASKQINNDIYNKRDTNTY